MWRSMERVPTYCYEHYTIMLQGIFSVGLPQQFILLLKIYILAYRYYAPFLSRKGHVLS